MLRDTMYYLDVWIFYTLQFSRKDFLNICFRTKNNTTYAGVNISHNAVPNEYGIVSKFTEFSEKFLVLRSQKIENFSKRVQQLLLLKKKMRKKSRFP